MAGVRKLTDEERNTIQRDRLNEAQAANPKAKIKVHVEEETDEEGDPIVRLKFFGPMGAPT